MAWQRISAILLIFAVALVSVFTNNAVAANSIKIKEMSFADDLKSSRNYLKNFHANRRLREVPTGPNPVHHNQPPAAPRNGLQVSKSSKWKPSQNYLANSHANRHLRDVPTGPNPVHHNQPPAAPKPPPAPGSGLQVSKSSKWKPSHNYLANSHANRHLRDVPSGPNPLHNSQPTLPTE